LFLVKIALEAGFTHIILCGVPMDVDANHITRHKPWHGAPGFARGWHRHMAALKPFVRSMSGWTQQQFGAPDMLWLALDIPRGAAHPR
jgi:hypothetical protein